MQLLIVLSIFYKKSDKNIVSYSLCEWSKYAGKKFQLKYLPKTVIFNFLSVLRLVCVVLLLKWNITWGAFSVTA